jgi:hypothetical protein
MKLSIAIKADMHPSKVYRWLGLEGQELLDAVKEAIELGDDEIEITVSTKKAVKVLQVTTPPMVAIWERGTNGN